MHQDKAPAATPFITSSSHTSTSTYLMTQPRLKIQSRSQLSPPPPLSGGAAHTSTVNSNPCLIARGAARTAFTHRRGLSLTTTTTTTRYSLQGGGAAATAPMPAPQSGSVDSHGEALIPAVGSGQGQSQGQGRSPRGKGKEKGEGKGKKKQGDGHGGEEDGNGRPGNGSGGDRGEKKGAKAATSSAPAGDAGSAGPTGNSFDKQAVVRLAQTVGELAWRGMAAYWRVVRPVFETKSEVRKRVDGGTAGWADWGACALAAGFVFLIVSATVWAFRGSVWVVRAVGEVGSVLWFLAGL
ncbi:hypothetical protein VTK26DRAFT_9226 [Humicola hyalothermophila]